MHARIGWQNLRTSEFLDSGNYMLITGTDFNDGAINFSTCHYVERERYEQDRNIQIHNGSILITKDGTLGKVAYVQGLSMPATLNAGVFNVQIKDANNVDEKYLFQYLKAPFLMDYVDKKATGGTIKHLNQSILVDFPVILPQRSEQTLIGAFFQQLDNLITLHQRKFEKLTNVKKSMLEKMFPQNGSSYPEIRFKGFTDPWEQRKFSELVQIERGGSPRPIDDFITDAPNGLNWIKIGDAPTQGNYITKTAEKIRPEGLSKTREVHPGDLILSNSMSFGKPYIMGIDGCIHDGWLLIRNTYGVFDLTFLCHLLGTPQMLSQYRSLAAGSTVNNLNKELVGNTVVTIPSITEQRVLGDYLEQLDNLITLHQRKFEKLTNVKKSMLEKMFPQNGSSYPEIRFKGFTDPWEQRKFSDITFPAGEKNRDNLPLESYSITNEHGFVPQDEKFENGGTMREADKRMYYIVSPNSFAYNPARINVGSIGYQNIGKNVIVSSLYEVFKTSEDVDDRLLWHWFKSPDFQKLIMQLQEGGVRLYFYYDKLCMGEVSLPLLEEQRKIGKLFDTLDNLITLHQRELEKLQNIKKSMLEKMFV